MSLPTKPLLVAAVILVLSGAGCTKQTKSSTEQQTQALTPEQKNAQDLQKSNEAVTEIGKKIGRKLEPMDIGLPKEKKDTVPPEPPPKK